MSRFDRHPVRTVAMILGIALVAFLEAAEWLLTPDDGKHDPGRADGTAGTPATVCPAPSLRAPESGHRILALRVHNGNGGRLAKAAAGCPPETKPGPR